MTPLTPEQWARVKAVFSAALERPVAQRAGFLDVACHGDAVIRAEVESLLAVETEALGFLDGPPAGVGAPSSVGDASASVLRPGHLIGRYRVLALLGTGGMGEVYLAEDSKLRRKVALKLLPRRLSQDPDRLRRFEHEARTASALSHPNVCVIYETGETEPTAGDVSDAAENSGVRHFIAMEYVAGETLRQRIQRARTEGTRGVPVGEAIEVAIQVATGLAAAHAAGVVHRDVKPENVIVRPDGLVKVLDFGLAKLTERDDASIARRGSMDSAVDTEPGMVLGTAQYMSPEQARALPVDARTDVWSLGAVLHELVAGRPAFDGETTSDVLVAVLEREPAALDALVPEIPARLREVIVTALQKDRTKRQQSMTDVARTLKLLERDYERSAHGPPPKPETHSVTSGTSAVPERIAAPGRWLPSRIMTAGGLIVALAAFGIWWGAHIAKSRVTGASTSVATGPTRLAVLPFENLGRTEDAYLTDGIADEVRGKLAGLTALEVIARASSSQYRQSRKPMPQIAQELGVQYVLTATVRWQPGASGTSGRIRVTPELIRIVDGRPVTRWNQPFDAAMTDVFAVQTDIAQRVAQALSISLRGNEASRLAARPTENLDAYDAYLRGEETTNALMSSDLQTLRRGLEFYERATALDSMFTQAWARVAEAHAIVFFNAPAPTGASSAAASRRAAMRAIMLAPEGPNGHRVMARYYLLVEHDSQRAMTQAALGLSSAPNDATSLWILGEMERSLGRFQDALAHFERAVVLDPTSAPVAMRTAETMLWLRRYPDALAALAPVKAAAPSDFGMLEYEAMAQLGRGDLAAARAEVSQVPKEVDLKSFVAFMATYWDLGWLLSDAQQRLLLSLGPETFNNDRRTWAQVRWQMYALRGDTVHARAWADTTQLAAARALRMSPEDDQLHLLRGVALAYLGRREEAIREGKRAVELYPMSKDAFYAPYDLHQLARIYILLGEYDNALDIVEQVLKLPYFLSPGWWRVDPTFAPLRGNARFDRLASGS